MTPSEQTLLELMRNPVVVIPLSLWLVFWKGLALWKAVGKRQLLWFMILLLLNTMGILEIGYIFYLNRWDLDKGKLLQFLEKRFKKKKT